MQQKQYINPEMKIMIRKFYPVIILLMPLLCTACQQPESYLQLLPKELWCEAMNCILSTDPLWRDKDENTRIDHAISVSRLAQELQSFDLQYLITTRMRTDLQQAKKTILEPFKLELSWIEAAFSGGEFPQDLPTNKKSVNPNESPRLFQKLLPFKSILSYWQIDSKWIKEFLDTKQCGGTLRKHIFINALQHRHEELVHYLWNRKYRSKTLMFQLRNRPFIRLASATAQSSGYTEIHYEFEQLHEKIKARIKAAQVYYPG